MTHSTNIIIVPVQITMLSHCICENRDAKHQIWQFFITPWYLFGEPPQRHILAILRVWTIVDAK